MRKAMRSDAMSLPTVLVFVTVVCLLYVGCTRESDPTKMELLVGESVTSHFDGTVVDRKLIFELPRPYLHAVRLDIHSPEHQSDLERLILPRSTMFYTPPEPTDDDRFIVFEQRPDSTLSPLVMIVRKRDRFELRRIPRSLRTFLQQ